MPTSDSGTATLGMTVAANVRRNRKMTMHDERDGQHQLELDVADRRANRHRSIGEDRHLHRRGQRRPELRQQRLDPIDDVDDVGARLTLDVEDHRRRVVHPRGLTDVFDRRR